MRHNRLLRMVVLLLLAVMSASCYPARYDGPYKGKVIDAATGKPIEGVVVLGVWSKVAVTPAGGVSSYYDAKEKLTDRKGEFEIHGLGPKILGNVGPMNVLIFKTGYEYIGMGPWESLKLDGGLTKKKVEWEGDRAIITLRRLTMEERKRDMPPLPPGEATYEKIKFMLNEYNENSKELGFGIIDTWRDKQ